LHKFLKKIEKSSRGTVSIKENNRKGDRSAVNYKKKSRIRREGRKREPARIAVLPAKLTKTVWFR
jgi:hypothetical protein